MNEKKEASGESKGNLLSPMRTFYKKRKHLCVALFGGFTGFLFLLRVPTNELETLGNNLFRIGNINTCCFPMGEKAENKEL